MEQSATRCPTINKSEDAQIQAEEMGGEQWAFQLNKLGLSSYQ